MRVKIHMLGLSLAVAAVFMSVPAHAGDAAMVVFRSGQMVRVDDGFRQIADALKALDGTEHRHKVVELNLGGGTFLIDVADAAIVCRDRCDSLKIIETKKGGARTTINVDADDSHKEDRRRF